MMNNLLSDSDLEDLMGDEQGRKVLVEVLKKLNHGLFSVTAHGEPFWARERLRESVKIAEPHLVRIAEEKRKKREEERKAKK